MGRVQGPITSKKNGPGELECWAVRVDTTTNRGIASSEVRGPETLKKRPWSEVSTVLQGDPNRPE